MRTIRFTMHKKTSPAFFAALLLLSGFSIRAQTLERRALIEGVSEIGAPGVPGPLCVFGRDAFPVVAGKAGENALAPVVAASQLGTGRVVAFGHNGYLGPETHADTGRFFANALRWAARNNAPRVGVRRQANLAKTLKEQGFTVTQLDATGWHERLKEVHVVCGDSEAFAADADLAALGGFIRAGGGFVTGSLGWGWLQLNPGKSLATHHAGNKLLGPAGIVWADGTLERTTGKGFAVGETISPFIHAASALDRLLEPPAKSDFSAVTQASWTATHAARSLADDDKLLRPRFNVLMQLTNTVPTAARPFKAANAAARLALTLQVQAAQKAAPDAVRAHPAAANFPGAVPANAPRFTRAVGVDTSIPRWHSTGLYAAAGEVVTVTLPANAAGKKLRARIGCHSDGLWGKDSWSRAPEITRSFELKTAETKIASAFGGLIYIEVPGKADSGVIEVSIANAVAAPHFVLGKTDLAKWRDEIRNAPAPWAEIEGKLLIVALPAANVRTLDDPDEAAKFWDRVVAAEDDLGAVVDRTSPERLVLDRQISAGYMHSGYPIMAHLDQADKVANIAALKKGNWGFFHELGHNHQRGEWTFSGTGEVTCNIFSMYCFEKVCGLAKEGHDAISAANREKNMRKYFGSGGTFENWMSDPFLALLIYHQLVDGFGWDAFKKVFAEYRDLPRDQRPKTDPEKHDQWLVRFSRQVGKNLGPFFQAWKIPTSQAARDSIQSLPVWLPEPDFPKRYQGGK
jgi:hypothetical protein